MCEPVMCLGRNRRRPVWRRRVLPDTLETMILKNLWRRKTRTVLTMLGVAVGVAAVVALSAFGEGFASGFESIFSSSGADLTVGQKDAVMLILSAVDASVGEEIALMPGVDAVSGTVIGIVQMTDAPYFVVMGEDPHGFAMKHYRLIAGGPLASRKQILLGKITAKNFNKQVGESFILNGMTYRVAGIYETGVNLEDGGAVMGLEDAQRAFDKRYRVNYFNVKVEDAREIEALKKQIEDRWPELVATRSGEATQQAEATNMYRSFGSFLGFFAVLVGGLGMMNTMLMSVFERTREIGVLRAVGWRRRRVLGLILGESLVLAGGGGALGIGLGIGLTALARLSPSVESLLSGVFTPAIFIQAVATALLLGALGGLYPAWRAAQLAPVEAMRYDSGAGDQAGSAARLLARFPSGGALRNLWRRPTRTLVTLLGLGIGVGFVVALLAMVEGFTKEFTQLAGAGEADLLAEQANASDLSFSVIDERVADRIAVRPEIKSVSKLVFGVSSAPGLPYLLLFGIDPAEAYIHHFRIREGRLIMRPGEIMIGRFAATGLKKTVGETVRLAGASYRIVGIYENGAAYEDAGGAILLKEAQSLFNKRRQVSLLAISIVAAEQARAEEIARTLEREYPQIIVSQATRFTERMQDFATTYAILNALILLTVVVGGIVMTNAMLISVFERTQEIGVLRALGWKRRRVVRMIFVEALALSLLSALVGIGLGVGLNYLFMLIPGFGAFLTPAYTPALFGQVLGLAVTLGVIGSLYPAWRAAGLRPIEALRYE